MALVTHAIKAITQGVSQQTPSVRLDSQVEEQVNMVSDLAFGLTKRNPVELVKEEDIDSRFIDSEEDVSYTYTDLVGVKKTVWVKKTGEYYIEGVVGTSGINNYLIHSNIDDIRFLELDNQVLILNRQKVVEASSTLNVNKKAILWIRSVVNDSDIKLKIVSNGVAIIDVSINTGTYATPNALMVHVKGLIDALGNANILNTIISSNTLTIIFDSTTFETEFTSDYTDQAFGQVDASVSDNALRDADVLPNVPEFAVNLNIRISPSGDDKDAFYLKANITSRVWEEANLYTTVFINESYIHSLSKSTPALTEYEAFGGSGDLVSNPLPPFIDKTISDFVVTFGRLVLASDNNIIMSAAGDTSLMQRTTNSTIISSDRLFLELNDSILGYKDIQNIFMNNGSLFGSTGSSQFQLVLPTDLNLTKAKLVSVSAFPLEEAKTYAVLDTTYFIRNVGDLVEVVDFNNSGESLVSSDVVNLHCNKYIKGDRRDGVLVNSTYFLRTTEGNTLYSQAILSIKGTRVQNAWSKMVFKFPIVHIYKDVDSLGIIFKDIVGDRLLYTKMPTTIPQNTEDTPTQIGYSPYLDYWQDNSSLVVPITDTIHVDKILGKPEVAAGVDIRSGVPFEETSVTLSEQVPRTSDGEVNIKLGFAKMMLRRFQGTLGFTGRLEIQTTKKGRGTTIQKHMPKTIGSLLIGREAVSDSDLKFSVNGRAEDIEIKIVDKGIFTPMNIISLEYQAQLITRGSRI